MTQHEPQWTAPAPMWPSLVAEADPTRPRLSEPAILRFTADTFMDDFLALLDSQPDQMTTLRVRPETWRQPTPRPAPIIKVPEFARRLNGSEIMRFRTAAGAALGQTPGKTEDLPAPPDIPLKLYQPAHQRYYLVAACLVCRTPGQPDRYVDPAREHMSFVVRRVAPKQARADMAAATDQDWDEYAFVDGPGGLSWQIVNHADVRTLVENEEQNPLFAVHCLRPDGHKRRVLAGLIPVGRRETYVHAPERDKQGALVIDPASPAPPDPRLRLFMAQATEPWKHLLEGAAAVNKAQTGQPPGIAQPDNVGELRKTSLKPTRESFQTTSWYILLDFAALLRDHLENVWLSLTGQPPKATLSPDERRLLQALKDTTIDQSAGGLAKALPRDTNGVYTDSDVCANLYDALRAIQAMGVSGLYNKTKASALADALETVTGSYERDVAEAKTKWPPFLFPLADSDKAAPLPPPDPLHPEKDQIDYLTELIGKALPAAVPVDAAALPLASQPVMNVLEPKWFVIRCVYQRPQCGPLCPGVTSAATAPFQMAGFFDPDAPARPIRIALPVDTSPAGLRKFDKNTAFMISDVLCSQIRRARGLGLGDLVLSVLPWPFHKDLDLADKGPCATGMICSLSIPIITICALILLMIIVSLFDFIFHWLPYLIFCFPLPKFEAKGQLEAGG